MFTFMLYTFSHLIKYYAKGSQFNKFGREDIAIVSIHNVQSKYTYDNNSHNEFGRKLIVVIVIQSVENF